MYRIYVNRPQLERNRLYGENGPAWVVEEQEEQTGGEVIYHQVYEIYRGGPFRTASSPPEQPSNGVTMWIESDGPIYFYSDKERKDFGVLRSIGLVRLLGK